MYSPNIGEKNRRLQHGMTLLPFKRINRNCHSGAQTQLTFAPINYVSFSDFLNKTPPPELTVSHFTHQVRQSTESYTFRRVENEKVNTICQTMEGEGKQDTESQTAAVEEEDTPLFRKNLRKVMDNEFRAAATRRDRNLSPLMNMVRQQKWES